MPATVVEYDPELDIAVLEFDSGSLAAPAVQRPGRAGQVQGRRGDPRLPGGRAVRRRAGRIRDQQRLRSPDIYGDGKVIREVYSVRGLVRPGNSGGPIVTSGGEVVGVVFAASVTDEDTGYALTAEPGRAGRGRRRHQRRRGRHGRLRAASRPRLASQLRAWV